MSSTKDRMKSHRSVKHIPTDSGDYFVRALTLRELDELDAYADAAEGKTEDERASEHRLRFSRYLIAAAQCEPSGEKVFSGPEDPDMREVDTDLLRVLVQAAAEKNNLAKPSDDEEGEEGNP